MRDQGRFDEAIRVATEQASAGADIDEVLRFMRESGFHAAHCIVALAKSGLVEQREAKPTVLRSPVWADVAAWHESFVREIEEEFLRDED